VEGVRDVEDDLGVFLGGSGFEGDGAVGVEELVGDVGEDGGAAGGDAAFGDEGEEAAEELADVDAGGEFGEFGEFGEEVGGEVFRVVLRGLALGGDQRRVAETQVGAGVQNGETAAATIGGEMPTPRSALGFALNRALRFVLGRGMIGGARSRGFESHFFFLSGS